MSDMNAVAGPSSAPYQAPPKGLDPIPAGIHPPVPSAAAPIPVRSPNGAAVIPTIVHPDGVKEVPHFFELCQVDDLITLIASMLDRLITHNDRIPLTPTSLTRFHSRAPPTINIVDYLLRIARYTNVEAAVLLILLPYVDKVCSRWTTFTINSLSVHRFVIAGVSVGSKALSDSFCTNGRYARVGGVSLAEMCLLEKEFCEAIDWRLTTTGSVLAHYYTSLVRSHPLYRLPPGPPPLPVSSDIPTPLVDNFPLSGTSSSNSSNRSSILITSEGDADMEEDSPNLSATIDISVENIRMEEDGINSSSTNTAKSSKERRSTATSLGSPSTDTTPSIFAAPPISASSSPARGRKNSVKGPALIPTRNLPSERLISASNLPSPVRATTTSNSDQGLQMEEVDLSQEVGRKLHTRDQEESGGRLLESSSSAINPSRTEGSPLSVEIHRETDDRDSRLRGSSLDVRMGGS